MHRKCCNCCCDCCCDCCCEGPVGATGPAGATGPTGATGATGASGTLGSQMYLYNYGPGVFAPSTAIAFDQLPLPGSSVVGMTLIDDETVQLTAVGLYRVDYRFDPYGINTTLALFLDGAELPGSRFTVGEAPVPISGMVLFELSGEVPVLLQLRTVDPDHNAELVVGEFSSTVNACLLITRFGLMSV